MRIGIITGEYPPLRGGISDYTDMLSRKLARTHDVFIFSEARAVQQADHIPLTCHSGGWGYGALLHLRRWIHENQLDLVNIQYQTAAFQMSGWLHFWPQWLSVPVVTTFHDLRYPYLFPKAGRLREWIVMHLAKQSAGRIVTNHADYEPLRGLSPTALIPIGSNIQPLTLSSQRIASFRKEFGLDEHDFVVAYFGFLNRTKGVDTLLDALHTLADERVHLLMIGDRTGTADATNQAIGDEIERRIADYGLESRIHWTGFVDDDVVSGYLQAADVVALPFRDGASFRRGSLMAAIAQGCAIITTTPQVTIPEFDDRRLMLVPPDNPSQLAAAIQTLHDHPAMVERLQTASRQLSEHFDWDDIAAKTAEFFQDVLGEAS